MVIVKEPGEDVLKLHILYLEKLEKLSKLERAAYEKYLNHLANPVVTITECCNLE